MNAQLRLPLAREPDFSRDRFATSPANAAALALVSSWNAGTLALVGPEGSGKTHLAHIWAADHGARFLTKPPRDIAVLGGQRLIIENAGAWPDPESLFHLLNMVQVSGALILTSHRRPALWPAALPDLRSRLNALSVAEIGEPDDEVLTGVLKKFFRERNIRPHDDVYPYLLRRMERSIAGAQEIVERLDETEHAEIRPVSRVLARQILEGDSENLDLFEG